MSIDTETRLKRLKFRADHRGTQEADLIMGGFVTRFGAGFSADDLTYMERLLEEQDVDILNWLTGTEAVPEGLDHDLMQQMQKLDYITDK